MLTLSPPPLPDESLYSMVCRAYLIDAGFTHRLKLKRIFNPMEHASDLEMIGSEFYKFWEQYLKPFWSLPKSITETTLYRLYAFTLPLKHRKLLVKWAGKSPLSIKQLLEQCFHTESVGLYYLQYCPTCIYADIQQFGVPYWHRSHCCKFAFTCYEHKCRLVKVGFISTGEECFQLPPINASYNRNPKTLLIEKQIYQRLNIPVTADLTFQSLKQKIREQFLSKRLGNSLENEIAIQQFHLHDQLTSHGLSQLAIRHQYADGKSRMWLNEFLDNDRKIHIPEMLLIFPPV